MSVHKGEGAGVKNVQSSVHKVYGCPLRLVFMKKWFCHFFTILTKANRKKYFFYNDNNSIYIILLCFWIFLKFWTFTFFIQKGNFGAYTSQRILSSIVLLLNIHRGDGPGAAGAGGGICPRQIRTLIVLRKSGFDWDSLYFFKSLIGNP